MAKSSNADAGKPAKKGGLMGLLIPALLLTVLAAGGGGLIGTQIVAVVKASLSPEPKSAAGAATPAASASTSVVKELNPVVTNLAAPDAGAWVRLQTAIVYDKSDAPQIDQLSARITDDILAFLRTLTLAQLQGASGLQHLREDLNERVSVRTDGHIHELMIETLVIQ
jgi:flagellar FliL protein